MARKARRPGGEPVAPAETQPGLGPVLERPARSPEVELVGEVQESGFAQRQWLIRRDGRFIQLTEPLYRVLEYSDGTRTVHEIAEAVTDVSEWVVTPEIVRQILLTKLLPLGLLGLPGSSHPRSATSSSALSVNLRMKMLGPRAIEPVTGVLQVLFKPLVLVPVLAAIAAAHAWLYLVHGVGRGVHEAIYTPGLLLAVLGIFVLSILVHEFGHASALRAGGGKVRGMGVGFYLMYPAFYTDTTDSYRLGRWARVRTDLGGFYFHLIFAVALIALGALTGQEFLFFVVVLINAELVRQLLPLARFDGYWALVDLTGMPDFFSQMTPFLQRLIPWGDHRSALPRLKRWVKAVFITYMVITIPSLLLLLVLTVTRLPVLAEVLSSSLRNQLVLFRLALRLHDWPIATAASTQILLLTVEVLGLTHLLYVSVLRPAFGVWNRVNPLPPTRRAVTVASASAVALTVVLANPDVLYMPGGVLRSAAPLAGSVVQMHAQPLTRGAHHPGSGGSPAALTVPARGTGAGGAGITSFSSPSGADLSTLAPPTVRIPATRPATGSTISGRKLSVCVHRGRVPGTAPRAREP